MLRTSRCNGVEDAELDCRSAGRADFLVRPCGRRPHRARRTDRVHNRADSIQRKQSIKGDQTAQYTFNAKAGQILTVDFKQSNTSAYFNILAKGADYALFNGSIMGNHFLGPLPGDGEYTVQVYLMRNAARRNEVAKYDLSLKLVNNDAGSGTRTK